MNSSPPTYEKLKQYYSELAKQAMLAEVNLTPKPGLVDRANNGAHRDMSLTDFYASADTIAQWFPVFIDYGFNHSENLPADILAGIRPLGIACEKDMLQTTHQVNTHKGSIFSLGLFCTVIGVLLRRHVPITTQNLCDEIALLCKGMIRDELKKNNHANTAGQRLYNEHHLTGARGEAESGYQTVLNIALPIFCQLQREGFDEEKSLHQTLLYLMAKNDDTNVASRGGINALRWLQNEARQFIANGGVFQPNYLQKLNQFDLDCIDKNLSPGGSADLLIITWLLAKISLNDT